MVVWKIFIKRYTDDCDPVALFFTRPPSRQDVLDALKDARVYTSMPNKRYVQLCAVARDVMGDGEWSRGLPEPLKKATSMKIGPLMYLEQIRVLEI